MKVVKRTIILSMAFVLLFAMAAHAAVQVATINPSLSFSGTTANCKLTVQEYGKPITATLELYDSSGFVTSWTQNGTTKVTISETYGCISGTSYYLRAYGTSGTTPFDVTTGTKVCP